MKNIYQIVDEFKKELIKNGIGQFTVCVKDPDSDQMYIQYGRDNAWNVGACKVTEAIIWGQWRDIKKLKNK